MYPTVRGILAISAVAASASAASADVSVYRTWADAHPVLHDAVIVAISTGLVAGAVFIGLYKWAKTLALRQVDRVPDSRIKRMVQNALRTDEGEVRRAITAEWIASMIDTPQVQARIWAAIAADDGRAAVAQAMTSDAAKREIAAAMQDPDVQKALVIFLNKSDKARSAIADVLGDFDLRDSMRQAFESKDHNLERAVVDLMAGEIGLGRLDKWFETRGVELTETNLKVAIAIARAVPRGLEEDVDALFKLQAKLLQPIDEDTLRSAIRKQFRPQG